MGTQRVDGRGRGHAVPALRGIAVLAILPLLSACPALGQDGGSRSVFAQGIGNRALAMGGAFGALSDDASGLLWNPGGLARIPRLQFEAGQTNYFGLGIGESYAVGALPSWRWGVVALSIRHYGVSGIDQRDDRNFVVGDPTTDSQAEVALGYGRAMGPYWNLGGTLRARRQSLAGYSASGFGADVGMTGRIPSALVSPDSWASDLTWGLSIANLLRPSLRLDRESVPDPTAIRTGLAWHHLMRGAQSLVVATDLERPDGMGTRLHMGAEYWLLPEFALRAGLDGKAITAGTGIRWRNLSLDYTYENREFDAVHRMGFSYALGQTVGEQRASAERVEAQRLQARMNDLFQQRQVRQIDSLLALAEARRAAGAPEEALDLLGIVTTLDPARADVLLLQAACHRQQGIALEGSGDYAGAVVAFSRALALAPGDTAAASGRERCQAISDARTRRSDEARQIFATALDSFGADRLADAQAGFRKALDLMPGDPDAESMLRRTHAAIGKRVTGLLSDARRSIEAGRLEEAAGWLDQAEALDPEAAGLDAAHAALARARATTQPMRAAAARDSARAQASKAASPAGTMLSAKEIDQLYRRGLSAMQAGRADEALRLWELVWSADPRFAQVTEYLKREYLTRGMEAFARGQLDEATGYWRQAVRVDPTDPKAAGYLERAQKQLSRTREILGGGN